MKPYLPGLHDGDEQVDTTVFGKPRTKVTVTAKWWMRPICWITRKPTTRTIFR